MQTLVSMQKGNKVAGFFGAMAKYAAWYPKQWLYWAMPPKHNEFGDHLGKHLRYIDRMSHKLARNIFHVMGIYQLGLEKRQQLLGRFVDIGVDLFAMAACCASAQSQLKSNPDNKSPLDLTNHFCLLAKRRVKDNFRGVWSNDDRASYKLAQNVLESKHIWLEDGVLTPDHEASKDLTSVS